MDAVSESGQGEKCLKVRTEGEVRWRRDTLAVCLGTGRAVLVGACTCHGPITDGSALPSPRPLHCFPLLIGFEPNAQSSMLMESSQWSSLSLAGFAAAGLNDWSTV